MKKYFFGFFLAELSKEFQTFFMNVNQRNIHFRGNFPDNSRIFSMLIDKISLSVKFSSINRG